MKKKYIFGLEVYNGYIKKNIGYFNKIESVIKNKNYEREMKKIRLYDGVFIKPYLYKDISQDNTELSIILYDIKFNKITTLFIKKLNVTKFLYNKNFSEAILEGEYVPYYSLISPNVMSLWLERCQGIPIQKNTWLKLSRSQRYEWLGQISRDERLKFLSVKIKNKIIEIKIDGNIIDDEVSFLFAFGEAVYGAGGYMGSGIQAFEDCLYDKSIIESTITLIWNNFKVSKNGFYKNNEKLHFKDILDVLNEKGIRLVKK